MSRTSLPPYWTSLSSICCIPSSQNVRSGYLRLLLLVEVNNKLDSSDTGYRFYLRAFLTRIAKRGRQMAASWTSLSRFQGAPDGVECARTQILTAEHTLFINPNEPKVPNIYANTCILVKDLFAPIHTSSASARVLCEIQSRKGNHFAVSQLKSDLHVAHRINWAVYVQRRESVIVAARSA
jgi:hypothetical protein